MAEHPVMDSAIETQNESIAPKPKPLNTQGEAAEALKNLFNINASETQESASEKSTKEVADSEQNTDETFDDDDLINQIEDETPLSGNQELYRLTVNGEETEVTLDELKKGYSRQSDYTRKTEKLSQDRKSIEEKNAEVTKLSEEAKIKRDQYERQLQVLQEHLRANETPIDMERLYQDDPAEFVKVKAEQDRKKELLLAARQEQERIQSEKQKESEKFYSQYLDGERKKLAEALPIYGDKDKGPEFVRELTNYAKAIGYTDSEIAMLVDHRAVIMLANSMRYDKLRKANLKNKKVTKAPRVLSSTNSNVQEDSDNVRRLNSSKATLRKTGKVQDAVSVLKEMYSR